MSSRTYLPLHLPGLSPGTVRAFSAPLRSCEPRLFLPFRVSVSLKRIGFARLVCPLLISDVRSLLLAEQSVRVVAARQFLPDTRQTSQVKSDNLRRTPAGFTPLAFDGWRTLLSIVSSSRQHCLLSDSCTSGRDFAPRCLQTTSPLRFANPSPPSSWIRDFHPQVDRHAWQTIVTSLFFTFSHAQRNLGDQIGMVGIYSFTGVGW